MPTEKKTYLLEVIFIINQFDFEPLKIKIFGSGCEKR